MELRLGGNAPDFLFQSIREKFANLLHPGDEAGRDSGRDSKRARSNRPLVLRQQASMEVVVDSACGRCKAGVVYSAVFAWPSQPTA